jgi:hypothetical protein
MSRRLICVLILGLAGVSLIAPAASCVPDSLSLRLERDVAYLASDSLEGRLVGTSGIDEAAAYIAGRFKEIGLEPAFAGSFYQDFEITFGHSIQPGPWLQVGRTPFGYPEALSVLPISGSGTIAGRAVIVHAELDGDKAVEGSVAFWPEDKDQDRERWTIAGHDGLLDWMRRCCLAAAEAGAAGVVFVAGSDSDPDPPLHDFAVPRVYEACRIPAFEISLAGFREALRTDGIAAEEVVGGHQVKRTGNITDLPGLECRAEVHTAPRSVRVRNVAGILRCHDCRRDYIVVGAHYDHLGWGDIASTTPWRREIHNGADDNASGDAVVLELAREVAAGPALDRSVVFICFTAEELGALGSEYYVKNCPYPIDSTMAMINFDTVGRLEDDRLVVFGAKSASEFSGILAEAGAEQGLDIVEKEEIYGFSDQNAFYARGIPSMHVFTGAHDDYHSPDDDWQNLNYQGLESITLFAADLLRRIARMQDLTPVVAPSVPAEAEEELPAGSHGQGAFLGIVPDFAYTGTGVGIKGTLPESPAEAAGLKEGDAIGRIDEMPIADLKDLMRFLASKRPGDEVTIHVMRGGEPVTLQATLSVRSPRE